MGSMAEEDTDRKEEGMKGGKSGIEILGASSTRIYAGDIYLSNLPTITATRVLRVSSTAHLN